MVEWGSAMQSVPKLIGQLNLLPDQIIREQRLDRVRIISGCLLLVLVGLSLLVQGQLQHKIESLELEIIKMEPIALQTRTLQKKAKYLQAQLSQEEKRQDLLSNQARIDPGADLDQIEAAIPTAVSLTQITLDLEVLRLSGLAAKPQDVAVLLKKLQLAFGDSLRLTACHYKNDTRLYQFLIEGKVNQE